MCRAVHENSLEVTIPDPQAQHRDTLKLQLLHAAHVLQGISAKSVGGRGDGLTKEERAAALEALAKTVDEMKPRSDVAWRVAYSSEPAAPPVVSSTWSLRLLVAFTYFSRSIECLTGCC